MRQPLTLRRLRPALQQQTARALVNRDYALFLAGAFVSALGSWLQTVALGWLVLDLGRSVFLLGLANFAQMVPLLLFGLLGGALADRLPRRTILLVTQSLMCLVALGLALLTLAGVITIPVLLGLAFLSGLCNALLWPAWPAFIRDLVGPERLRPALALNAARFNLTRILGPVIGGLLLAQVGVGLTLLVGALSALGVVLALLAIRPRPPSPAHPGPWRTALTEGLVYAWRAPLVRRLLVLSALLGLVAFPYQAFLPAVARERLGLGPEGLGLLLTAVGVGAVSGALWSGTAWVGRHPHRALTLTVLGTGLGLCALAAAAALPTALGALVLLGLASIAYLATANATVQLAVPEHLTGRIMGLWVVVNSGTMPLGSLLLGALAERLHLSGVFLLAGGLCLLLGLDGLRHWQSGLPARRTGVGL